MAKPNFRPLSGLVFAVLILALTLATGLVALAASGEFTLSQGPAPAEPATVFFVGHRGAPGLAPENTLASYDAAIANGAHMVEVDVMGMRWRGFSQRKAAEIRKAGISLFANVMGGEDGPVGYEAALQAGARFIQSDHIDQLHSFLDSAGRAAECLPDYNLGCYAPEEPSRVIIAAR